MTKITFVEASGTAHDVDAQNGKSLMIAAVKNAVPGIDADCGGKCMCATCHIILDDQGFAMVGNAHTEEQKMLNLTPELTATSRLACQIEVREAFEGLSVRMPKFQM